MKNVGVTDYTYQTPSKHFKEQMSSSKPPKRKTHSGKVRKIKGTHVQCLNNHNAQSLSMKKRQLLELQIT